MVLVDGGPEGLPVHHGGAGIQEVLDAIFAGGCKE
jgi:hypothetical protein